MSEFSMGKNENYMKELHRETGRILEDLFRIEVNTRDKILEEYFSEGYLPRWYFYSNSPLIIAHHIYMLTHFLNANSDMLSHAGKDNRSKTYFINVGRDYPGRLAHIIRQNRDMDIVAIDSEGTASGLRIVTIDKAGEHYLKLSAGEKRRADELRSHVAGYGRDNRLIHTADFLSSLSNGYLREEISVQRYPERIFRHLHLYEKARESEDIVVESAVVKGVLRLSTAFSNPGEDYITGCLDFFKERRINLERSYYDLFDKTHVPVGIFSFYVADYQGDYRTLEEELTRSLSDMGRLENTPSRSEESRVEKLIRKLSAPLKGETLNAVLEELYGLCEENLAPGKEKRNFYINSVTDFLEAAKSIGLDRSPRIMHRLLGFEGFDEFFVVCPKDGISRNKPGYRIKHSSVRGPSKGGLRIDPIVNFGEVAALSFMMTWKSARSRILFGGAKGGLMVNPREYDPRSMDFFDTLSNFGRSLFLVTGPARDVPAGDVGCGADEIGRMFEGFKSALRDLALMANGVRHNVTMIGDQIISLEEARQILEEAFGIDYDDRRILRELSANQEYLELVVAAQITGKPKMGIQARTGATGRGLCYAALAAVTNLFLRDQWEPTEPLTAEEKALLREVAWIDVPLILEKSGADLITDSVWERLTAEIYPKLLRGKKMVVQGSGKVGSSIIREMSRFGTDLIALSDAGGAVLGESLDPDALLEAVEASRNHEDPAKRASVIHCTKGVDRVIPGAGEGSVILELDCDLLFPAALENAVTEENAPRIRAKVEVCGSNGSNSSKAEKILQEKGVTVVYDFLANSGGVIASYFEWLRNLNQRARYEAEKIYARPYDMAVMDAYVMAEFRERIKAVLARDESPEVTHAWNTILRDIMFSAVNEDCRRASERGTSLKTAGFVDAQFRVLAASLIGMDREERDALMAEIPPETAEELEIYFRHPEAAEAKVRSGWKQRD